MELKILLRSQIQLGIPLARNIYDVTGKLLMIQTRVLHTELQLARLLRHGAYVDASLPEDGVENVLFAQPLRRVAPTGLLQEWEHIPAFLQTLFTHPERKYDFPAQVAHVAAHIVKLHDKNVDFSIYRIVRQENYLASSYGYTHAMHTAVMCLLLSRHFEWPADRMMSLVKAALTMNMTIAKLQGTMAGQAGPVEKKQRTEIYHHPENTVALLKGLGVTDDNWLAAVQQHHEREDGTGYPTGCKEISEIANLLRVTDVFTSKISPRTFRAALSAHEGILRVFRHDKGGPMSMAMIKTLGIYPPGEFVRMASGELGIVVERTANSKAPIVASITDTAGRPVPRLLRRDTREAEFAVTGTVSDKVILHRLLPERLYGFSIVNAVDLPQLDFLVG